MTRKRRISDSGLIASCTRQAFSSRVKIFKPENRTYDADLRQSRVITGQM
jgi:hypothetical protein